MGAPLGNKYALGNTGGRPPMFASSEEMNAKIEEYFNYCKGEQKEEDVQYKDDEGNIKMGKRMVWVREPEIVTITGLCLYLGFCDRQSFYDYERKNEFSHIVKRARLVVENKYEEKLSAQSPTGAIFALKNMGWSDKQEIEVSNQEGEIFKIGNQEIKFS